MLRFVIYALVDPGTDDVFYVGRTIRPRTRLLSHIWQSKTGQTENKRRTQRIAEILLRGQEPQLRILDEAIGYRAVHRKERRWVQAMKNANQPLTNGDLGGVESGGYRDHPDDKPDYERGQVCVVLTKRHMRILDAVQKERGGNYESLLKEAIEDLWESSYDSKATKEAPGIAGPDTGRPGEISGPETQVANPSS